MHHIGLTHFYSQITSVIFATIVNKFINLTIHRNNNLCDNVSGELKRAQFRNTENEAESVSKRRLTLD